MAWPPNQDDLEKLKEMMMRPPDPDRHLRIVSPDEYAVLSSMADEGYRIIDGYPTDEDGFAEFCKRMEEKRHSRGRSNE